MSISAMSPFARQAAGLGELDAAAGSGTDKPRKTATLANSGFDISLSEEAAPPYAFPFTANKPHSTAGILTVLAAGVKQLAATPDSGAVAADVSPSQWFTPRESNGLQAGGQSVAGYSITAGPPPVSPAASNSTATTNLQGAFEALRLVRLLFPGAELTASSIDAEGGTESQDTQVREIVLPNGSRLNAALVLSSFHQARSVNSSWPDAILQGSIGARTQDWMQALPNKTSNNSLADTAAAAIENAASALDHPSIGAVRQAMIDEGLDPDSVRMNYSSEYSWTPDGGSIHNFLVVETDKGRKVNFSAELSLESPWVTVCTVRHMLDGTGGWNELDQIA